jgi:hypothetical protein
MQTDSHDKPISAADLGYERERLRNHIHQDVLRLFDDVAQKHGINRAIMARRLRKTPSQITRWLGAPGNWTVDTISDLMLAMGLDPLVLFQSRPVDAPSNHVHRLAARFASLDAKTSEPPRTAVGGSIFATMARPHPNKAITSRTVMVRNSGTLEHARHRLMPSDDANAYSASAKSANAPLPSRDGGDEQKGIMQWN